MITSRVFARVGLLGNPSDGYGGACLSLSLANFYAEVRAAARKTQITLQPILPPAAAICSAIHPAACRYCVQVTLAPSSSVEFAPNPDSDPSSFPSLSAFAAHIAGSGYYGGLRLVMATAKRFAGYCAQHSIALDPSRGFALSYTTNIPRQRGLSGSSALACATLNCLLEHYNVSGCIPVEDRPALALAAEQELGIAGGLQDRVAQIYGGLVFMDFSAPERPVFESLDPGLLPQLHLVYRQAPSGKDSGGVHTDLKRRWEQRMPELQEIMRELADLARRGRETLMRGVDMQALAGLMRRNFELRLELFGVTALGSDDLGMIIVAESVKAAAKFAGSGGALVCLCPDGDAQAERLKTACSAAGLVCAPVEVGPVLHKA